MYSHDPSPDRPPPSVNESISPPPDDTQAPPPITEGDHLAPPPGWQPEVALPERPITHKPNWPHPNFFWSLLWCILFVLVTQVPGALVALAILTGLALLAPKRFPAEALANPTALLKSKAVIVALGVAFSVAELLVVGFSLLVIRLVVGRDWMRQLALRRPSAAHTLLAVASFPSLALLANLAYHILRNVLHMPSLSDWGGGGMEEMVQVFSKWPWSFAVLVIGVGPGIGEELWCRGFLGRGLVGNYGAVLGVLATSFFFGLIHMDPAQGTMAMLMGLWLHFVYLMTRSLWLPMLLHFLNNSLAVLITRFPELQGVETEPADIPMLVYLSAFLLLSAVAYALYQGRARLMPETPQQIVLWRPDYEGVEYPPPGSGTRVVHPTPAPAALALVAGSLVLFAAAFVSWAQRG